MNFGGWKLGMVMVLMTALVACGNSEKAEKVAATENTAVAEVASTQPETVATEVTPEVAPAVTGVDEKKVEELLTQFKGKTPEKAVTLSVAITEIINELGIVPVGVPTTSSQLPEAFASIPRVGTSHQVDLEQITKLQPDVVYGPASIKDSLEKQLQTASLPTAYLPVDSLDELKLSLVTLGRLYNKEEKATAFLEKVAQEEKSALAVSEGKTAPKVMFLFGSVESLMFMNEDTYAGSLAKNLGALNVVSNDLKLTETYVPISMESVVAADPDVILLVAHGDPTAVANKFEEDVKKSGAWENLKAFKNNNLKTLDYNLFGIASLSNAPAAYKELAQILYP